MEHARRRIVDANPAAGENAVPEFGISAAPAEQARPETRIEAVTEIVNFEANRHIGSGSNLPNRHAFVSQRCEILGIESPPPVALMKKLEALLEDHLSRGFEFGG